jgi:hypothetical protein
MLEHGACQPGDVARVGPSLDPFDDAPASAESEPVGGYVDDRDVIEEIVPEVEGVDTAARVHFSQPVAVFCDNLGGRLGISGCLYRPRPAIIR